jgi:RNA polymerase sigma factor (sigma-70 family)
MAHAQLDTVLRHLHKLFAPSADDDSDGQLLGRFVARQDEAAFTALLQRHGPMVLAVCRREVGNEHDAEDAFQATFLVLARRAHSIRKHNSVASWLHGVAYRVAARLRTDAARRRQREAEVQTTSVPDPILAASCRELATLLDAELNRLPRKYREPFVLCCLEGHSKPDAARRLGWKEGTVSGRLARARALLRTRLTRQGVTPAGGLVPWLASGSVDGAVPAALLTTTVQAINGPTGTTTTAAALADRVVRSFLVARIQVVAAALTALVLAAGTGVLAYHAGRPTPLAVESAAELIASEEPAPRKDETGPTRLVSASGRIVDPKGQPVAGVPVYLRDWVYLRATDLQERPGPLRDVVARTTTDAQGRFTFKDVRAPELRRYEHSHPWEVVVRAAGYGLVSRHLWPQYQQHPFTLHLPPAARVQGRLVGPDGQPVAGAWVEVQEIAHVNEGVQPLPNASRDNLEWSELAPAAVSDADGRFLLDGLPPDARVVLVVRHDQFARQTLDAVTTDRPYLQLVDNRRTILPGGTVNATLRPGKQFRGRVLHRGQPVAGAYVALEPETKEGLGFGGRGQFHATTDEAGRFTVKQLSPGSYFMGVYPPDAAEAVCIQDRVAIPADRPGMEQEITLPPGAVIAGTVTDAANGKGLAGVGLYYESGPHKSFPYVFAPMWLRTGPDGRFRFAVPAGKGQLELTEAPPEYATAERMMELYREGRWFARHLDLRPSQTVTDIAFALDRGRVLHGRVVDPEGKPVAGAHVRIKRERDWRGVGPEVVSDADGRFILSGLDRKQLHPLLIGHRERALGLETTARLSADEKQAAQLEFQLRPLGGVRGRVVDEDGKPVAGVVVEPYGNVHLSRRSTGGGPDDFSIRSDEAGRFALTVLLPGQTYRVQCSAEGYAWRLSDSLRPSLARRSSCRTSSFPRSTKPSPAWSSIQAASHSPGCG